MRIEPAASLEGAIAVPGVKGICQRAVLLAAIADGESVIRGFGRAADTESALSAVQALGARVEGGDEAVRVHGLGLRGLREPDGPIDCGNAGTVLRLLAGILAGQDGRFELTGGDSLRSGAMERVAEPLRLMGANVETNGGRATVVVEGASLRPVRYELPVASAQVKSAILLAGLLAESGPTVVVEPLPTRDHTERLLRELGVRAARSGRDVSVLPVDRLPALDLDVAGDFSSAAPFVLAATLLEGSELLVHAVNTNPLRTGFLDVLTRMGANIAVFNRRTLSGEPVADLEVRPGRLVATHVPPDEVPRLIDELPLVALAASMARGETVVGGAAELRVEESDGIDALATGLHGLGGHVSAVPDGFRVRGVPTRLRGGRFDAYGDHRLAMLGAVAGLVSREGVEIQGAQSASISFPGFFELLEAVTQR